MFIPILRAKYVFLVILIVLLPFFQNVYGKERFDISKYRKIHLTPGDKKIIALVVNRDVRTRFRLREYWWYDNLEIHRNYGGHSGYLLHGEYSEYSVPANILIVSGNFRNGLKDGLWLEWHSNGRLKHREVWHNGTLRTRLTLDSSGKPISKHAYKRDKLDGWQVSFFSADSVERRYFRHDTPHVRKKFIFFPAKNCRRTIFCKRL